VEIPRKGVINPRAFEIIGIRGLPLGCIVVHYSEIGTKKDNRIFFEVKLSRNIKSALRGISETPIIVKRLYGRIIIDGADEKDFGKIRERLKRVPGISHFSLALSCDRDMETMKKVVDVLAAKEKKKGVRSFAISAVRSDKGFRHSSQEINEILGEHVGKKYRWKVDLKDPGARFHVEVAHRHAFVYTEKTRGMGGLPVTSGGKLICLISGGIDSPVAAVEMMKRGCQIVFLHFQNLTKDRDVVEDKVEKIVGVLSGFQPYTKLYVVPFGEIQRHIIMKVPADMRMIIYRRIMLQIANILAKKEGALGFVTGDSVGQVASQTLENLNVIYKKAEFPVLTPLIGTNKEDIIRRAEDIGTYGISILPYSDCCSYFIAKHPKTRARLAEIESVEGTLDMNSAVEDSLKNSVSRIFGPEKPRVQKKPIA
jgi:thiamine biosynthesis protein ThiI